jgi:SAM-dependent methyltransferase
MNFMRAILNRQRPPPASAETLILSEALTPEQLADPSLRDQAIVQSGPIIPLRYYIERIWVDDQSLYIYGFLFIPGQQATALCYLNNGATVDIPRSPRPDVVAFCPDAAAAEPTGFSVLMPFRAGAPILLEITTALGVTRVSLVLAGRSKVSQSYQADSPYIRLKRELNRPGARILEIGSRAVSPLAKPRVDDFPLAAQFVGVDIHPGRGVDVVCDAHALSSVFKPASFDYVFSLSVFEHLAAPWLVAAEINRVLTVGGEVMVSVPFAWPLHETPSDFWRFSDKGLERLFSPELGFSVIESRMNGEIRLIPEWRDVLVELPLHPSFNHSWIFARKIAECPAGPAAAPTHDPRLYPNPAATAPPPRPGLCPGPAKGREAL